MGEDYQAVKTHKLQFSIIGMMQAADILHLDTKLITYEKKFQKVLGPSHLVFITSLQKLLSELTINVFHLVQSHSVNIYCPTKNREG